MICRNSASSFLSLLICGGLGTCAQWASSATQNRMSIYGHVSSRSWTNKESRIPLLLGLISLLHHGRIHPLGEIVVDWSSTLMDDFAVVRDGDRVESLDGDDADVVEVHLTFLLWIRAVEIGEISEVLFGGGVSCLDCFFFCCVLLSVDYSAIFL
jgi:hypothetical protein